MCDTTNAGVNLTPAFVVYALGPNGGATFCIITLVRNYLNLLMNTSSPVKMGE